MPNTKNFDCIWVSEVSLPKNLNKGGETIWR